MLKLGLIGIPLLAVSLFVSPAPAQSSIQRKADSTTVLKALADPLEEPYYCAIDDNPVGILPEIAALFEEQCDFQIQFINVKDYGDYQAHLEAKDFDLLFDASDLLDSAYLKGYDLTNSYMNISYSKVTYKNSTKSLSNIASLGANSMVGLYTRMFYYSEQCITYSDVSSCLEAVKNETCYATVVNSVYAEKLQNEDIRNTYSFAKLSENPLAVKIAVKHEEGNATLSALNAAIAGVSNDTYNSIVSRYSLFVKPTLGFFDQVYLNPLPYIAATAGFFLLFAVVIYFLGYAGKRRATARANLEFERFITYVCQTNEAVYEVNLQNRTMNQYQIVNRKVKNLTTPFSEESDLIAKVHPDDQALVREAVSPVKIALLIQEGAQASFEVRLQNPYKAYFWALIIIQGILPSHQQPENFMVFIRSINEQKEKEAHAKALLQDAVSQAETASKSKSEFLARMSHEIRTPLNAIIGLATIARHYEGDPEKVDDCLGKINSSSKVLLSLVNDILDMSAIENNKIKIAAAEFNLTETMKGLYDIYEPQCRGKDIELLTRFDVPDPLLIGDQLRLSQILLNLLSNAYKFTPSGGHITLAVARSSSNENRAYYRFQVIDNGVGMSDEMKKRLFKPFEQESAETAQKYGGSGLGLSIVKSLVVMMGGTISVDSHVGQGTVFTVDLPFLVSQSASSSSSTPSLTSENEPEKTYDFKGARVLLAEDNAINREIAIELLKMVHLEVDCAQDGQEALQLFAGSDEGYYQAILLDLQMPIMDGYEACRHIRKLPRPDAQRIPIFAMTANAYSEDVTRVLAAGMNGHIAKPVDPPLLYQTLANAIIKPK